MVAVTSLFKHPKTGMYWVRRKVPTDLRAIIGKWELQRTTGTKDLAEAKVKAKPIGIEIDRIFADARGQAEEVHRSGIGFLLGYVDGRFLPAA